MAILLGGSPRLLVQHCATRLATKVSFALIVGIVILILIITFLITVLIAVGLLVIGRFCLATRRWVIHPVYQNFSNNDNPAELSLSLASSGSILRFISSVRKRARSRDETGPRKKTRRTGARARRQPLLVLTLEEQIEAEDNSRRAGWVAMRSENENTVF